MKTVIVSVASLVAAGIVGGVTGVVMFGDTQRPPQEVRVVQQTAGPASEPSPSSSPVAEPTVLPEPSVAPTPKPGCTRDAPVTENCATRAPLGSAQPKPNVSTRG